MKITITKSDGCWWAFCENPDRPAEEYLDHFRCVSTHADAIAWADTHCKERKHA